MPSCEKEDEGCTKEEKKCVYEENTDKKNDNIIHIYRDIMKEEGGGNANHEGPDLDVSIVGGRGEEAAIRRAID